MLKPGLKKGARSASVAKLQDQLIAMGYLGTQADLTDGWESGELEIAKPEVFDQPTENALKQYQTEIGLNPTGILDKETIERMQTRTCGYLARRHNARQAGGLQVAPGKTRYTYSIENPIPIRSEDEITATQIHRAIDQAFSTWARFIPLSFVRVPANGEITITFGLPSLFEGCRETGNVIAANSLLFPSTAHNIHFNMDPECVESLGWIWFYADTLTYVKRVDFISVAIHEVGHMLGLGHYPGGVLSSIGAEYAVLNRSLQPVDIQAIQALHGPITITDKIAFPGSQVVVSNPSTITVERTGATIVTVNSRTTQKFQYACVIPKLKDQASMQLCFVELEFVSYYNVESEIGIGANGKLTQIELWDGDVLINVHRFDIQFKDLGEGIQRWGLELGIASKPVIQKGLTVSMEIQFFGNSRLKFVGCVCHFRKKPALPPQMVDAYDTRVFSEQ